MTMQTLRVVGTALLVTVASASNASAKRWLSQEAQEEWTIRLNNEAQQEAPPLLYWGSAGQLVASSGFFPIPDAQPNSVLEWLTERRDALGVSADEFITYESSKPFFEFVSPSESELSEAETATAVFFGVRHGDHTNSREIIVIIHKGSSVGIRGIYNSHAPPVDGYESGPFTIVEAEAWDIAERTLGQRLERRSAVLHWSNLTWLLNREAALKKLLWIVSGLDENGAHRTVIIDSAGTAIHISDNINHYNPMPFSVEAYGQGGSIYWESQAGTGCTALSASCTDPAFTASQFARTEFWFLLESWRNLSSATGASYGFEWPWTATGKAPLASTVVIPNSLHQRTFVVVAHTGTGCSGINGTSPPPCSNYTRYWMSPSDNTVDLYGHEYGHSLFKDLKIGSGHPIFSKSGSFIEFVADFIGISSEDMRLRWLYPNAPSPRTDFKIASSNLVIDWPTGACSTVNTNNHRTALGKGLYDGWNQLKQRPTVPRDILFRSWRLTAQYALYFATDMFPTATDFVGAMVSMTTPPSLTVGPYPSPNTVLAPKLVALGCF